MIEVNYYPFLSAPQIVQMYDHGKNKIFYQFLQKMQI